MNTTSDFMEKLIERLIQELSKSHQIHNHGQSNQFFDKSSNTQNYYTSPECVNEAINYVKTLQEAEKVLEEFKKKEDFKENYDSINKYMRNEEETQIEIYQISRCTDIDSLCAHVGKHMASKERLSIPILTSSAMIKTFEFFTSHKFDIEQSNFHKRVKRCYEEAHPECAKKVTPRNSSKTAADNRGIENTAVGNTISEMDRGDAEVK